MLNRILKKGPMCVVLKGGRVGISDWRNIINSKRKIQKEKGFIYLFIYFAKIQMKTMAQRVQGQQQKDKKLESSCSHTT